MSKILLVEPCVMLQHAFVHALFPEHSVEIAADLTAAALRAEAADLVIVDAAMLRQRGAGASEINAAAKGLNRPTICVDVAAAAPDSADAGRLSMPFFREELYSVIARVLSSAAAASSGTAPSADAGAAVRGERPLATGAEEGSKEIIELVDAIEEPAETENASAGTGSGN